MLLVGSRERTKITCLAAIAFDLEATKSIIDAYFCVCLGCIVM